MFSMLIMLCWIKNHIEEFKILKATSVGIEILLKKTILRLIRGATFGIYVPASQTNIQLWTSRYKDKSRLQVQWGIH